MEVENEKLCKTLEVEIIGFSALMEAEELLDREGSDYFRGFIEGYSHCLKLAERLDVISNEGLL